MLGEIGAELQSKCTDENRIFRQITFYGENCTDGQLPERISIRRRRSFGMPLGWWQERLALIVVGRKVIHAGR